jgi:hypothetical protein
LREGKDPLKVNWIGLTITDASGKALAAEGAKVVENFNASIAAYSR